MNDLYRILDIPFTSRLWACVARNFRGDRDALPIDLAEKVLVESGTDVLIIYVLGRDEPLEDDEQVCSIQEIKRRLPDRYFVEMICTNLATSAKAAVEKAICGVRATQATLVKLDVFDGLEINNREVVKAALRLLDLRYPGVIPFIRPDVAIAGELLDMGVPALRLQASEIGLGRGIGEPDRIGEICAIANVPVIVEGGIGSPEDVKEALSLGATAVLVNSAILRSADPIGTARAMREAVRGCFVKGA